MPLVQSLDILRPRLSNPVFKSVLDDVHEKVRGGTALSDAFAAHGDLFPGVYTASLMAGERSGNLDAVLRRFVAYSKMIDTVRKKTISAMMYPAILIGAGDRAGRHHRRQGGADVRGLLRQLRRGAAAVTRVIVAHLRLRARQLCCSWSSLGGGGVAFSRWMKQPGQRARFDRLAAAACRSVGASVHKFATSQLARTLATLLGGGIPLVNALDIAARSTGNRHMGEELRIVADKVREGQGFAATLLERQRVPDVAIKMIEVGESTGALTEMLNSLADFYDEEIETEVGPLRHRDRAGHAGRSWAW